MGINKPLELLEREDSSPGGTIENGKQATNLLVGTIYALVVMLSSC
ncbi:hypothetical protein ACFQH2_12475 [Natronoarchaeum sp. GCM10025703]